MRLQFQIKHLLVAIFAVAVLLGVLRALGSQGVLLVVLPLTVFLPFGVMGILGARWGAALTEYLERKWTRTEDLLATPVPDEVWVRRWFCFLIGFAVSVGVLFGTAILFGLLASFVKL